MDAVNRLIQAGILSDCANSIVLEFEARGDMTGLENYVSKAEQMAERRKTGGDNREVRYG